MQKVKVSPAGCLILLRICVEYCLCRTDFWSHLTNKLWDIGASLVAQLVKNLPAMQGIPLQFGKIHWRRDRLPTPVFLGFACGSTGKESTHSAGDLGSIPGLGRSPGKEKGYALHYSGLENSMDCIVCGVARSWT